MVGVLILSIVMAFVGRYVAIEKGRSPTEGFLFGFFLSVLGVIIIALMPTKEKNSIQDYDKTSSSDSLLIQDDDKTSSSVSLSFFLIIAIVILFIIWFFK